MFAGAGRLDGGVDGQQVGLVGDVVDDGDARRYLLHGVHHLADRLAAVGGAAGRPGGDVLGHLGIVGILADGGGHLLDRGTGLLDAGGKLGGGLGEGIGGGGHLLGGGADGFRHGAHLVEGVGEAVGHALDCIEQARSVVGLDLHRGGEIPLGDAGYHLHRVGGVAPQLAQYAASHQQSQDEADEKGGAGDGDEDLQVVLIDVLALIHGLGGEIGIHLDQIAQQGIGDVEGGAPLVTHQPKGVALGHPILARCLSQLQDLAGVLLVSGPSLIEAGQQVHLPLGEIGLAVTGQKIPHPLLELVDIDQRLSLEIRVDLTDVAIEGPVLVDRIDVGVGDVLDRQQLVGVHVADQLHHGPGGVVAGERQHHQQHHEDGEREHQLCSDLQVVKPVHGLTPSILLMCLRCVVNL